MSLILSHPEVAGVSCADCERWIYNRDWTVACDRLGKPLARPKHSRPPCRLCPKCEHNPEASPAIGRQCDFSIRNQQTLMLYYQKQACPECPTDDLMRRNFGIIQQMFEQYDRAIRGIMLRLPRR